jgi:uncharacterized protein (DUF1778 family)
MLTSDTDGASGSQGRTYNKGRTPRLSRLEARITKEQKELFMHAADIQGRSLTDFMLGTLHEEATRIIHSHEVIRLSRRDSEIFINSLLNPPSPGPRLKKAAEHYKKHVTVKRD